MRQDGRFDCALAGDQPLDEQLEQLRVSLMMEGKVLLACTVRLRAYGWRATVLTGNARKRLPLPMHPEVSIGEVYR